MTIDTEGTTDGDKLKYALGSLRVIPSGGCGAGEAKAFAQAGIDLIERGAASCAEMRGDVNPTSPAPV